MKNSPGFGACVLRFDDTVYSNKKIIKYYFIIPSYGNNLVRHSRWSANINGVYPTVD
jgi:hypothetical protein